MSVGLSWLLIGLSVVACFGCYGLYLTAWTGWQRWQIRRELQQMRTERERMGRIVDPFQGVNGGRVK